MLSVPSFRRRRLVAVIVGSVLAVALLVAVGFALFGFIVRNYYLVKNFKVEIGGKVYTDRKEAGTAIREAAVEFMANDNGAVRQPIGTLCGFELSVGKSHGSFGGGISNIAR